MQSAARQRRCLSGLRAVQDVDFAVSAGETLGVVGESGCGKSTPARMLVGLTRPTAGTVVIDGGAIVDLQQRGPRAIGRTVQYVFQDPLSSLNPCQTIRRILEAPLVHLQRLDRAAREHRLKELLAAVNLRPEFSDRYPHEFSDGQASASGSPGRWRRIRASWCWAIQCQRWMYRCRHKC